MNKNTVAMTPPMGWNSWDCYETRVNEQQLLDAATYQAKHLRAFGWEYIVCDIQWSAPPTPMGTQGYRNFVALQLDEWGRQLPDPERFPSSAGGRGFAPIAEKIHAMDQKFGIHIMRGIPRQAVHARMPVKGTDATADQIASPFSISRWNGDMYGVLDTPDGQAYYDSLFEQYAAWGVDFVKVDDICNTNMYPSQPYSAEKEVEMIARAIDRCGRPMVLSLSPGPAVIEKAWHLTEHANMWRITDDFWDDWKLLKEMFWRCEVWQAHVSPGNWPDCDMLPLGLIGAGHEHPRLTCFTREEQRTLMTLWCVFRSPLMMGGVLPEMDEWTLSLLTNARLLRLMKHSYGARQVSRDENEAVWHTLDEDGSEYWALFNLSDEERVIEAPAPSKAPRMVTELWEREGLLLGATSAKVPAHGAVITRLER